jgi:hypothetical protein
MSIANATIIAAPIIQPKAPGIAATADRISDLTKAMRRMATKNGKRR